MVFEAICWLVFAGIIYLFFKSFFWQPKKLDIEISRQKRLADIHFYLAMFGIALVATTFCVGWTFKTGFQADFDGVSTAFNWAAPAMVILACVTHLVMSLKMYARVRPRSREEGRKLVGF